MESDVVTRMDPHMLVGIVNTRLRSDFEDLEDLCGRCDWDLQELKQKLERAGYRYVREINQFR